MSRFLLFLVILLFGCASPEIAPPVERWAVVYYDRNGDGMVDYELHTLGSGHADADWALIDTQFRGRYDLRINWGYVLEKKKVDIPISDHVKITPGKPPKYHAA